MKVKKKVFQQTIAEVSSLVNSKSNVPVLRGVLFSAKKKVLRIVATNLRAFIEKSINGNVQNFGSIVVSVESL